MSRRRRCETCAQAQVLGRLDPVRFRLKPPGRDPCDPRSGVRRLICAKVVVMHKGRVMETEAAPGCAAAGPAHPIPQGFSPAATDDPGRCGPRALRSRPRP